MVHFQMELGWVFHDQIVDFYIVAILHIDHMRTVILINEVLFIVEKVENPPMIAPPVDFSSATDLYIEAVVDLYKIPVFCGLVPGPEFNTFGCG